MKERFDYGQNPDKTEGGELISSYGCDHMTADAEFLLSKAKYKAATGREQRRDADVLCYQIRQSFKPGEITPEEANRIGYETAMRWTKGKYAFFVATHTDKAHIHNHIYYNSTSLDCTRKFRDFIGSGRAVRRLSDRICLENELSVITTRGQSLLAGNVFCGHCGSRLALTTNGKAYPCKEDAHRIVKRVRYICYGKTRKQTECDGQTGYTAHILDGIIDKVVRQIFERMKAIPKSEIVNIRYREKMEERKALLKSAKSDYAKAAAELDTLRAEVIKSLRGESAFPQDLLSSLISDCETKCLEVQHTMETAQAAYDEGQAMLDALNAQYDDIISWADMYDSASMESKKMIVSCLIRRVEVYRDYRLHIDFNIDFEQFSAGLDISAIAA